jgi:predicted MPP superfamily phosphohydrolase
LRSRLAVFIAIVETIILAGHLLVYLTAATFLGGFASSVAVKVAFAVLSVTFVSASLLGWYFHNPLVRLYYVASAAWLGLASFLLWASVLCWLVWGLSIAVRFRWAPQHIADILFGAALLATIYGIANAAWLRVTRIQIALPNLPARWRGRTAALVSDTHLGHVRNGRFIRRLARKLAALQPDIVFLAGDVYDGTSADFEKLAQPWQEFISRAEQDFHRGGAETRRTAKKGKRLDYLGSGSPASSGGDRGHETAVLDEEPFLGVYYIPGNHEEFYSHAEYLPPLVRAGVRLLNNEKVNVDGLQLLGVHYRDAIHPERYRQLLRSMQIDRDRASLLLLHAPVRLAIAEEEGVSLQLSGHTHGGQFFPYTLVARRVWGKFIHGLQRVGNLQVFTSYGAGTWGPPLRVGTRPEIVLITFE